MRDLPRDRYSERVTLSRRVVVASLVTVAVAFVAERTSSTPTEPTDARLYGTGGYGCGEFGGVERL